MFELIEYFDNETVTPPRGSVVLTTCHCSRARLGRNIVFARHICHQFFAVMKKKKKRLEVLNGLAAQKSM